MEFIKSNKRKTDVITLYDRADPVMTIVPVNGAVLAHLKLKKGDEYHPVLWDINDEELLENPWFKQSILFPYPNRLEEGQFRWQGEVFQFPINEKDRNNQLHGFLYNQPFEVEDIQTQDDQASISLHHTYSGQLAYYPFPFDFIVTYSFRKASLEINFEIKNNGSSALPYGVGWHPYFILSDKGDYLFKSPALEKYPLNERSIPSGTTIPIGEEISILDQSLDDVFRIMNAERHYQLIDRSSGLQLTFDCHPEFNFLQLFTPPNPGTVAVEPMTCLINAFNNKEGLSVLPAGSIKKLGFSVRLS